LVRRWRRAAAGEGQAVPIAGEPGIGKSRLVAALRERLTGETHTRLRYFSSPHQKDSALYPFTAQLERAALFERDDPAERKLDKLEALLVPASPPAEDLAHLAELLALPSRNPPPPPTPQRRREKTFAALLRRLEALVRQEPVLMAFEDLHWIDPSSRELLDPYDRAARKPAGASCRHCGWALVKGGRAEEGLARLRAGLDAYRAIGAKVYEPRWFALLADACLEAGRIEEGLWAVHEGLAAVEQTAARYSEAELDRLEGELLLATEAPDESGAEASFRKALETACTQQAKSWDQGGDEPCAALRAPKGNVRRRVHFSRPSTTGSAKASTRPTSKRRRRCSTKSKGRGMATKRGSTH
jgi:hypothetical protein